MDDPARREVVLEAWDSLAGMERFLFNKLITGSFRVGVSAKLMTRALARATGAPEDELAHRLMGSWTPETTTWHALIEAHDPRRRPRPSLPLPTRLPVGLTAGISR